MVFCTKCGIRNEEKVNFCLNCGATLYPNFNLNKKTHNHRQQGCFGSEKKEEECFGLPNSGAIAGIIFGLVIILFGIGIILKEFLEFIGPLLFILFGVLVVLGAIYSLGRKR